jgi:hypothetical protein
MIAPPPINCPFDRSESASKRVITSAFGP